MQHNSSAANPCPNNETPPWQALHAKALLAEKPYYIDPQSGYMVWTELHHQRRGHCCQSGCRHCPFGFDARQAQAGYSE